MRHLLIENRNRLIVHVRTVRAANRVECEVAEATAAPYPGYAISQHPDADREQGSLHGGWIKVATGLKNARHRAFGRVGWRVALTAMTANLIQSPELPGAPA